MRQELAAFRPDFTVVTTAPSYLFWRCAPPELRIPRQVIREVRDVAGIVIGVGPHSSTTPGATLAKLDAGVVVIGECEEVLPKWTGGWAAVDSICFRADGGGGVQGATDASNVLTRPALG